jgi:hypothetical protein
MIAILCPYLFHSDEQVIEKVKLSQYSHASAKGERVNSSYSFLTSALHEAELSTSVWQRFNPCTYWVGSWVCLKSGSGHRRYKKSLCLLDVSEVRTACIISAMMEVVRIPETSVYFSKAASLPCSPENLTPERNYFVNLRGIAGFCDTQKNTFPKILNFRLLFI